MAFVRMQFTFVIVVILSSQLFFFLFLWMLTLRGLGANPDFHRLLCVCRLALKQLFHSGPFLYHVNFFTLFGPPNFYEKIVF